MRYKVTKQYPGASESQSAQFSDPLDARFFIEKKMIDDAPMRISVTYRLYEFDEIMAEYDPAKTGASTQQTTSSQQGAGSSAGARPTPFNTAPRPTGMPQKWGKEEDDKEKK